MKLEVELPEGVTMSSAGAMAISPDGKHIAFVGRQSGVKQVYVRSLEEWDARPILGTDGARMVFFSADSQWVGYATATRLWKVARGGGQAIPICEVDGANSAFWAEDDTIYFASFQHHALARVNASGGVPQPASRREGQREWIHDDPEVVPGGKALLFGTGDGGGGPGNIIIQSLVRGERKTLLQGARFPRYAASGHLIYESGQTTMARAFDKDALTFTGPPVPIEGVGLARFSPQGTLVSVPSVPESPVTLVWVDRKGTETPVIETKRSYLGPRVSPDGSRLAFWILGTESHVWILDLRRGMMDQFTTIGRDWWCSWSPDGSRIAFISLRSEKSAEAANLYCRTIDGSSPEEQLTQGPFLDQPTAWTRDGKSVIFQRSFDPQTGWDVMLASLGSNRVVRPLLNSPANELRGELSPDNRWLAYISTEGGTPGIYVRPFLGPDRKWRISPTGVYANDPLWSPDGEELFYRDLDAGNVMSVKVETEKGFAASPPTVLFEDRYAGSPPYGRNYDIAPDGQRFVMVKSVDPPPRRIVVVLNWFEELKRLAGPGRRPVPPAHRP
jgi:serine/threonine-protein kinase